MPPRMLIKIKVMEKFKFIRSHPPSRAMERGIDAILTDNDHHGTDDIGVLGICQIRKHGPADADKCAGDTNRTHPKRGSDCWRQNSHDSHHCPLSTVSRKSRDVPSKPCPQAYKCQRKGHFEAILDFV